MSVQNGDIQMFNHDDKYTNLSQSKILEPIMSKLGVQSDGDYCVYGYKKGHSTPVPTYTKKYRLDTLLWVLPDWVLDLFDYMYESNNSGTIYGILKRLIKEKHPNLAFEVYSLIAQLILKLLESLRGSKAIAAATELIKLLYDNDLLPDVETEVKNA